MTTPTLCRKVLEPLLKNPQDAHPGLLLGKGLTQFPQDTPGSKTGELKSQLIQRLTQLGPSRLYKAAYQRWQQTTQDKGRFASFVAPFAGRLYLGTTRDNPLETGITTAHTYGMPLIPGSAIKGLCRACAGEWLQSEDARRWMFGNDADPLAEAGGLVFHDAWWVPSPDNAKPFVAEVVTVHHPKYYQNGNSEEAGTPATDFDSPIPAPQIAVHGAFYFCLEGDPGWAAAALQLLKTGLQRRGIGGKRSSGYGFIPETTP